MFGFLNPSLSSSFLEIKKQLDDSESRSNKLNYKKVKYENYPNLTFLEKTYRD